MNLNGKEYFYIRNVQNDVIGLHDSEGKVVVSYSYDTWGNIVSITGSLKDSVGVKNPYRYRGYRYDEETGLYYLQSRYYNAEWGRFINADALIGQTGDILSFNMFAYCHNNPVNMSDESGYLPKWLKKAAKVVKKTVSKVVKKVKAVVKTVKNKVVSSYKNVKNAVKNYGPVIKSSIKQTSKNVASSVKQTGSNLINKGKNFVTSTTSGDIVNAVGSGIDNSLSAIETFSKFATKVQKIGACGIGLTASGILLNFKDGITFDAAISSAIDVASLGIGYLAGLGVTAVMSAVGAPAIAGILITAGLGWVISVTASNIKRDVIE
ncbi:RHS repeat-associated core domain-containing protein [Clostridium bornimense]|nr:RHS repeat-associated core domain-containing protein [Clostridium bornimense]MBU5316132.1 RHS repeat-associated core domain-containing protein [Clostridium bornimense]